MALFKRKTLVLQCHVSPCIPESPQNVFDIFKALNLSDIATRFERDGRERRLS